MNSGSYHRIGKFDIWYGYEGSDKNNLRIEWPGDGLNVYKAKLIEGTFVKSENSNYIELVARSNKGKFSLKSDASNFVSLKFSRWFIFTFWARGSESGYKSQNLVNTICQVNKI